MKNYVARFKSLPVSTRRLLSIGILLALVVALPLFIWAILNNKFLIIKKAASGEPGNTIVCQNGMSDNFDSTLFDLAKWSPSDDQVSQQNGTLKIEGLHGEEAQHSLLSKNWFEGDFDAYVDVKQYEASTAATNAYATAELRAYADDNNYFTIRWAKWGDTNSQVNLWSTINGQTTQGTGVNIPGNATPTLRLARTGNIIRGFYNLGSGYVEVPGIQATVYSGTVRPQIYSYKRGPAGTSVQFDNFRLSCPLLPTSQPPTGTECGMCGGIAGIKCQTGLTCSYQDRRVYPDRAGICVKLDGNSRCGNPTPPPAGECQTCGGISGPACATGLICQRTGIGIPERPGKCVKRNGSSVCNVIPTPVGNSINWNTSNVNLSATNFYINIQGKGVYLSNSNVSLHSDPGNSNYTTLEATWQEQGVEMRLFMYFARDPGSNTWSVTEMRTYNGVSPGNWIYYPGLQGGTNGTALNIPNANFRSNEGTGLIHMENMVLRPAFSTSVSGTQTYTFNVKLVGVTDGAADGAQVRIRFKNLAAQGGVFDYTTSPVPLTYIGNGTYQAALLFGTVVPLLPGGEYTIFVKGEKHLSRKFCQATGQTFICTGDGHIQINGNGDHQTFDFTGLALEPGDVNPQDGAVNSNDFNRVIGLLAKPCSTLTDQEKLTGDLDYNGCVTVKDVFLIRQTLQARYDEN